MVDAPEKIRVAQDSDGFWTCREAISGSQEYVRADLVAELEAEVERLRRLVMAQSRAIHSPEALSRTGGVKVKPLEWTETYRNRSNEEPVPELDGYEAESVCGFYCIELGIGAVVKLDCLVIGEFDDIEEAKAAAQADYERRILSALAAPSPAAGEEVGE